MTHTSQDLPIVAIHGFTGDGLDFEPLRDRTPGRTWHTPTVVGHEPDHAPADVTFYTMHGCVRQILDDAPKGPFDLLGYSMGGRVALHLTLRAPERVRRLALIGATPGLEDPDDAATRRHADEALARRIEHEGVDAFLAFWRTVPIIASQERIDPKVLREMRARRARRLPHGLANSLRGMGTGAMAQVWERLPELMCPTWLVTGAEDEKFDAIAARMAELIPNATHLRIPDAGHSAHLERPDAFIEALEGFLGSA